MQISPIRFLWRVWKQWLQKRREVEFDRIQADLNQAQWQNSLVKNRPEADLAAGYNLSHFNTMQ